MNKKYGRYVLPNKDIIIMVSIGTLNVYFINSFNSISSTYFGFSICETFINTLKVLLKIEPNFLDYIDEIDLESNLKKNNFIETTLTDKEINYILLKNNLT